jgi:phage I-like protein
LDIAKEAASSKAALNAMARTLAECENDRYEAMQVRSNMNWEDHAANLVGSNSYAYFSLVIVSGATER